MIHLTLVRLKNDFVAARGVTAEMLPIDKIDLFNVDCYTMNGQTGEEMIASCETGNGYAYFTCFSFSWCWWRAFFECFIGSA